MKEDKGRNRSLKRYVDGILLVYWSLWSGLMMDGDIGGNTNVGS